MTLQPFLELYQSDFPIILNMFDEIINIVKTLMNLFIKADVVDSCFHKDLKKIHLSSKDNFISSYSINIGYAAINTILELRKDFVSSKEISSFQNECRTFLLLVWLKKLFERMLNGISILENVTIINPQKALEFGQQKCIGSFQGYIQYVARISIVLKAVADKSCLDYSEFIWLEKSMYFKNLIGKPKD